MSEDSDLDRLKDVARRLDDLFELPLPDAPGCAFVGGRFVASDGTTLSFGAADPERPRAFRRCIGEAAETLSQYIGLRREPLHFRGAPSGLRCDEEAVLRRRAGPAIAAGWMGATRLSDGSAVFVPAALCFRDAALEPPAGLSLGAAAGRSLEEATLSALYELIERDAIALWWRAGAPARRLDTTVAADLLARLRGGGNGRRTWLLDITSDIGVPVVAALSCEAPGSGIAAGFAARATLGEAADAALLELMQMELGNRLVAAKAGRLGEGALAQGEREQLARMRLLSAGDPRIAGIDGAPDRTVALPAKTEERIAAIVKLLGGAGVEAFRVDLTAPAIGIPAVKIIAPRLAAEPVWLDTPRLARKTDDDTTAAVSTVAII